jgi:large subunit ribosomal protein L23
MSKAISLKPRLNEKTYGLAESRVYVFDVDRSINKHSIARAVESQFEVTVVSVNTTNIHGKVKNTFSLDGKRRGPEGRRSDFKKAYVTLAEGQGLPFFEAIEEEEQKEQVAQEKFDKAAAKQAEKEEKVAAKTAKKTPPKKPAAKKADMPAEAKPEEPAEKPKRGLSAWRGFRLRKKKDKK